MKLVKLIPRRLFLSLSILPVVLVPSAVLADEPTKSPPLRAIMEAREIRDTIVITVKGSRPERFFEQYIFVKAHSVDLAALLAESGGQRGIASGRLDLAKYVTVSSDHAHWKQDHIGIAIPF